MRLEKWALVAEVISGIAIVASLIVLIFEIRESTELARIAAYDAASRDFDESRRFALTNPDLLELSVALRNGELPNIETEPQEGLRAVLFLLTSFSETERAYLAYQAGIFGEDEWARVHRSECIRWGQLRQAADYYSRVSFRLTDRYVDHLNSTCTPEFVAELQDRYEGNAAQ